MPLLLPDCAGRAPVVRHLSAKSDGLGEAFRLCQEVQAAAGTGTVELRPLRGMWQAPSGAAAQLRYLSGEEAVRNEGSPASNSHTLNASSPGDMASAYKP